MRTIYIYLCWTGWIWFVIAGTYLIVKIRAKRASTTEAKQSNEQ
jgi:TM2 domain-containing membrane protein YozV